MAKQSKGPAENALPWLFDKDYAWDREFAKFLGLPTETVVWFRPRHFRACHRLWMRVTQHITGIAPTDSEIRKRVKTAQGLKDRIHEMRKKSKDRDPLQYREIDIDPQNSELLKHCDEVVMFEGRPFVGIKHTS